jgi:chromate transporter
MIKLRSIFFVFLRLGALTFGGGLAMLPIIKRDIVDRGWIPEEEFSDYIAVAQVAPGMIAINIATLVGMHLRKRLGALVAVIGVALPSIVVITVIASLLSEFAEIELVQKILKGIIRNIYLFIYAVLCFAAVYYFGISSVLIIALSFVLGTIHTLIRKRVD